MVHEVTVDVLQQVCGATHWAVIDGLCSSVWLLVTSGKCWGGIKRLVVSYHYSSHTQGIRSARAFGKIHPESTQLAYHILILLVASCLLRVLLWFSAWHQSYIFTFSLCLSFFFSFSSFPPAPHFFFCPSTFIFSFFLSTVLTCLTIRRYSSCPHHLSEFAATTRAKPPCWLNLSNGQSVVFGFLVLNAVGTKWLTLANQMIPGSWNRDV